MDAVERVRRATMGSRFEGRLFLVGGAIRDRILGRAERTDVDIVVVGDALEVADLLHSAGISDHRPVVYPRFGTARVQVSGVAIELASARSESYDAASRKPEVRPASLREDVLRRDFTINTLVEDIHHGGVQDLTGMALADLNARLIRTPLSPSRTFADDPLRMLRAIRFAVTLGFAIEPGTWRAIAEQSGRIDLLSSVPRVVSAERVRDEFERIILSPDPAAGMELLMASGLLARFLPELVAMKGVIQNAWHARDVWDHTMEALRQVPDASLAVRLGLLFHDVGKPVTRTEDERGVHFYGHENIGADMTRRALHRLRMPAALVREASDLVALHMRLGQVAPDWTPAALRRLVRDVGPRLERLHRIAAADIAAMGGDAHPPDLDQVMARIADTNAEMNASEVHSPLDGGAVMRLLGVPPGPIVGRAKDYLVNEIIEGRLQPDDVAAAERVVVAWMARGAPE